MSAGAQITGSRTNSLAELVGPRRAERLLDKWAVEEKTSLDITTIYRKMKAGTFPQPVRVGKRRVAWRESDIAAWQEGLVVGVRRG